MGKKQTEIIVPDEIVMNKIYLIRGQKVMLDKDLAELYNVETKRLKEAVKRNSSRFPIDFMFELTQREVDLLRSQIATSKAGRGGTRYLPMVFTEHGVLMLSTVLNNERAISVNIQIIRIFTQMRKMLNDTTEIRLEIEKIKKKLDNHDKNMELVFQCLDELIEKKENPKERKPIGFKIPKGIRKN
ncbi:MAG: DNA-binding protein [Bacteroidetes bacterium]|nr:DNA-binding protein [Bacteroidota bacterium]